MKLERRNKNESKLKAVHDKEKTTKKGKTRQHKISNI